MKQISCFVVTVITGFVTGCRANSPSSTVNGAGATGIYPLMASWAKEYVTSKGMTVNYQSIGSGGGLKQMMAHTVAFGCTDWPMTDDQIKEAEAAGGDVVHIPLALRAVVPVYNVPQANLPIRFSGEVLADIYLGKITNWNDPALARLNPDTNLPDLKIAVHVRGDASGTTRVWTDYLSKVSPEWKRNVGVGSVVNWPTGFSNRG